MVQFFEKKLIVFMCIFVTIRGKPVDEISYNYDEINHPNGQNQNNLWNTEDVIKVDTISSDILKEICQNKNLKLYVKDIDVFFNCEELFNQEVLMVKREAKNDEVEGSGDVEITSTAEVKIQDEEKNITDVLNSTEVSTVSVEIPKEVTEANLSVINSITTEQSSVTTSTPKTDSINLTTPKTLEAQTTQKIILGVSLETKDEIKNNTDNFNTTENVENGPLLGSKSAAIKEGEVEIAKTGESTEQASVKPNTIVLLVFVGLGCLGAATLAFNYIKSKRESEQEDLNQKNQEQGREMKPLMKINAENQGTKNGEDAKNTQEPTPYIDE